MLGQGGAAPGAPGHHALTLVKPAVLMTLLEEVPDVLDVRVGHREVRVLPVHPLAKLLGLFRLDAGELLHALPAFLRELVEPVFDDLALGVQSEVPLDFDFHPESLAVEAVLIALVGALHGLEALENVLVSAAPRVVDSHRIVGRYRAVDERPVFAAAILLAQLVEYSVFLPEPEHLMLHIREVQTALDLFEHSSDPPKRRYYSPRVVE